MNPLTHEQIDKLEEDELGYMTNELIMGWPRDCQRRDSLPSSVRRAFELLDMASDYFQVEIHKTSVVVVAVLGNKRRFESLVYRVHILQENKP